MRFSHVSRFFVAIAIAAAGCQNAPPPPVAVAPATPLQSTNPTVVCEHGCSDGYDACLDGPQVAVGGLKNRNLSDPAAGVSDPKEICLDQLKACLRRCLN